MTQLVAPVSLDAICAAAARCDGVALYTPLVRCGTGSVGGGEVYLKLENLQPVGAFKARPIASIVLSRPAEEIAAGLYTASSGNSAIAVTWMASRLGLSATALIQRGAPEAKLAPIRALGARIELLDFADWWRVILEAGRADQPGLYVDAVRDPAALAGNGTIGMEIIAQLADCDAVFAPFGGGGLLCGIGCALRALRPDIRLVACELDSAAPLTAAFKAGRPVEISCDVGYLSGIGVGSVLPEMWPLLRDLVDEVIAVPLADVTRAIAEVARANHVVMEGAGAVAVAAALGGRHRYGKVCAVVSGGNLDSSLLAAILDGRMASPASVDGSRDRQKK